LIGSPPGPTAITLICCVGGGSALAERAAEKTAVVIKAVDTATTRNMVTWLTLPHNGRLLKGRSQNGPGQYSATHNQLRRHADATRSGLCLDELACGS